MTCSVEFFQNSWFGFHRHTTRTWTFSRNVRSWGSSLNITQLLLGLRSRSRHKNLSPLYINLNMVKPHLNSKIFILAFERSVYPQYKTAYGQGHSASHADSRIVHSYWGSRRLSYGKELSRFVEHHALTCQTKKFGCQSCRRIGTNKKRVETGGW